MRRTVSIVAVSDMSHKCCAEDIVQDQNCCCLVLFGHCFTAGDTLEIYIKKETNPLVMGCEKCTRNRVLACDRPVLSVPTCRVVGEARRYGRRTERPR